MKRELLVLTLVSFATVCSADDAPTATAAAPSAAASPQSPGDASQNATPAADPAAAAQRSARPRQVPVGTASATEPSGSVADKAASADDAPKFSSEAKWELAGYNNDEVVYTVFVTNQDPRIIRCTTEVKGFYFENGTKLSIADRQITTVFPNQPTRVGYWMDMDQQSGASYSVKCHPV